MHRLSTSLVILATIVSVAIAGCTQTTPAPAPTIAAATPAAVATPAAAATAEPTTAIDSKVTWPEKGKTITWIVPWSAGGSADIAARVVAGIMEKELGVPVQVVNKTGAGGQVGFTELAHAEPDGYTVGSTHLPAVNTVYLDPERKAAFKAEDLQPVARYVTDPAMVAVSLDSPYQSLKELLDDAKANPEQLSASTTDLLGLSHMSLLMTEQAADVKFTVIQFPGAADATTALLGGHIDAAFQSGGNWFAHRDKVRLLGIQAAEESEFFPGVKTFMAQGYNVINATHMGMSVPGGTPKEIVDILAKTIKKAVDSGELKSKMDAVGMVTSYKNTDEFTAIWRQMDKDMLPLIPLARK